MSDERERLWAAHESQLDYDDGGLDVMDQDELDQLAYVMEEE
jgi:hypothetical protein